MGDYKSIVKRFINNRRFNTGRVSSRSDEFWRSLTMTGTELWLDTGSMEEARTHWADEMKALTTNNTLLNREVQKGIYDHVILESSEYLRSLDYETRIVEIAFILNAIHGLRLVSEFDTRVSVELHTGTSDSVSKIVSYGKRLHSLSPRHFIIKVPFSAAGIIGARKLGREGIPVNFTLGFSARQNYFIASLARPAYLNLFIGRVGAFVSSAGLGSGDGIGEAAVKATALAMREVRYKAAADVKLIVASIRDSEQLYSLAGAPVFTIPPAVAGEAKKNGNLPFVSTMDQEWPLQGYMSDQINSLKCFWEIEDDFKDFVERLSKKMPANPDDLVLQAQKAGFGWLFPELSAEEKSFLATDGKIPYYSRWKKGIDSGKLAPDILLALAGLAAFNSDQEELDRRISGIIPR